MRDRSAEHGVAMVTAIAVAIVVSLTAATVLNLTWRRFELSASRSDRDVALAAAEVGLQYAFARLDVNDTNQLRDGIGNPVGPAGVSFQDRVGADADGLLISSDNAVAGLDHWEPNLHVSTRMVSDPGNPQFGGYVGGKHVTVRITLDPTPTDPARPFVSAQADYGT